MAARKYIRSPRSTNGTGDVTAKTLPEALKEMPSVRVQKTAHGQGSPFIRGFTGFRTLMLIDGVRLNNSTFREGPNQHWNKVDIYSVDRLEVVKGPSSVMYGSDAIGGTVNAITARRQKFGEGFDAGGRLFHRGATAGDSHTVRGEASGSPNADLGILLGGTWKDYGELDGGSDIGRQPKTGYDELDWDAKLEYKPSLPRTPHWSWRIKQRIRRTPEVDAGKLPGAQTLVASSFSTMRRSFLRAMF